MNGRVLLVIRCVD